MNIGVDFGTSFSETAVFYNNNAITLETRGNYGTPSVFYYNEIEGGAFVGAEAERKGIQDPAPNLVRDVKMKLDQTFTLDGRVFSSSEIVKNIYGEIIKSADEQGKDLMSDFKVDGVVISHPAKFSIQEIGLLVDAVTNCIDPSKPIKVLGTIKEPVAAALTYYHADPQPDGTNILVFDLGGGTCDVAIVTSDKKIPAQFKVVDADMLRIGGRDWDNVLINYVVEQINAKNKSGDVRNNVNYMKEIRNSCVEAKHALTKRPETTIRVNLGAEQYHFKITQEMFDCLTVPLLEKALNKLDELYERNASIAGTIKAVVCVGGSSMMPQVKNGITGRFPNCEVRIWKPEYAVVNGAAILAERLVSGFDFIPFSYGICGKTKNAPNEYVVRNIIRKDTRYPITCVNDGFSIPAGQFRARLDVYESECKDAVYACNGTQKEKLIGFIYLDSKVPTTKEERITCKLTISSLHTIEIEAHSETISDVSASFKLANI